MIVSAGRRLQLQQEFHRLKDLRPDMNDHVVAGDGTNVVAIGGTVRIASRWHHEQE